MTPNAEPNSLPTLFCDWSEWRTAYETYVAEFRGRPKTYADETVLKIQLRRLGFVGVDLERELTFIKENI